MRGEEFMKEELLSVIVPVYNVEKYLDKCINSILSQSYKNLELILIDDGSTDESARICDKWGKFDKRVKVFHQENAGQQAAQSVGIKNAVGTYMSFIDSDDWIDSCMYERLVPYMENCDLVTSGMHVEDSNGKLITDTVDNFPAGNYANEEQMNYFFANLLLFDKYDGNSVIGGLSNNKIDKIFRTSIVKEMYKAANIGVRLEEDYLFVMLYAMRCKKIVVTHDIYYHYVKNLNSVTAKLDKHFLCDREKVYYALDRAAAGHLYEESLKKQLQKRSAYFLFSHYASQIGFTREPEFPKYDFPDLSSIFGMKVVLFGAGSVGKSYHFWITRNKTAQIVLHVDNKIPLYNSTGVQLPSSIQSVNYDIVLIAVLKENVAFEIRTQLESIGVPKEKIIWKKPSNILAEIFCKRD